MDFAVNKTCMLNCKAVFFFPKQFYDSVIIRKKPLNKWKYFCISFFSELFCFSVYMK